MSQYVLGMPAVRGNSDVSENYQDLSGMGAGLAVILKEAGGVEAYKGSGAIIGVSGYREAGKSLSVWRTALSLPVRLADGATPAAGKQVYITSEGKFTDAETSGSGESVTNNTKCAAMFKSVKVDGLDVLKKETVPAALIDLPAGL